MLARIVRPVALCALSAIAGGAAAYFLLPASGKLPEAPMSSPIDDPLAQPETASSAERQRGEFSPDARPPDAGRLDGVPELVDDELTRLAHRDPVAAMNQALAIEWYWTRLDAIERIASAWVRQSPHDALAYIQSSNALDPPAKSSVRFHILSEWVEIDSRDVLRYLVSREGRKLFHFDPPVNSRITREVAARQPYEMLAAADMLPVGWVRNALREAAIEILADDDLPFALRQVAFARSGSDRAQWVRAIQSAYVNQDPEGALEWAARFDAELPGTRFEVETLVRELYPDRAEEMGL